MAGADQVVCPFFGVVYERLQSFIYKDQLNKLGPLVKEELRKLFKTFLKIKEVLDDAEEKQFNEEAVRVRFWLQELNDAAYEADDIFDEVEYEVLQQVEGASSSSNKKRRQRKQRKIQKLIQIFDKLAEECSGLELQKGKEKSVLVSPDRITDPFLTESKVYGRDKAREELVMKLLELTLQEFRTPITYKHPSTNPKRVLLNSANSSSSSSGEDNFSVFPIQGMGGLGKTTLAKMVYNDERVQKHFDFRSWVCISTDFDTRRIMKEIVASLPKPTSATEKSELQKHFHKELRDKRLLVVLDDVWDVTQDEWNEMKAFFRVGRQGISVIVTTRLSTAACITGALHSNCISISGLSDKNCWKLFKQYAFGFGNEERPALVKIGKKIVKKCQGLPLAAKALGGLLRFKNDETEWRSIKDSAIWIFKNNILPALRLSYYHLSFPLKRCFVYCSIFPKDLKIGKEKLIELWMANGLVQPRAEMDLVDAANAIFNELLWRSFFQDIEKDKDGNIISCKMHDLVHDLASSIAGDEYFLEDVESSRSPKEGTRHAFVQVKKYVVPPSSTLELMQRSPRHLRSLIKFSGGYMTVVLELIFSKFILLRALDLGSCYIKVIPDSIGEMKHLRYLNLSHNPDITSLPESICLLRNMQTLNLGWCPKLASLPAQIEKMRCLINLVIEGCDELTSMPVGIGQLPCLRTLSRFVVSKESRISVDWFDVVGKESGSGVDGLQNLNNLTGDLSIDGLDVVGKESGSGVDGLQNLNNLTGHLSIYGLDAVETLMEAKEANLKNKKNIHSLKLCWDWAWAWSWGCISASALSQQQRHHNVIEGLQPHSNLRKLKVEGYEGVTLSPSWLTEEASSLLPNLVQISLSSCTCEHLGSLRKLPRLKILDLYHMDSLKFIEEGEVVGDASAAGGFPSLEELKLVEIPELEGWSSSSSSSQAAAATAVFPCLKKVALRDCPKVKEGVPLAWSPVQHVDILGWNCNWMVLGSLQDLPSLPSLQIHGFKELEYFPSGTLTNLTALHKLEFSDCHNLKALPVELYSLATLTELKICECPNLVSLAAEEREGGLKNLSSLKTLVIEDCHALKSLPELGKASLVTLRIKGCPEMEFSREDFEHLVVLEELKLYGLPNLVSLAAEEREGGLKNISSLKTLDIAHCKALKRLPELGKASLVSLSVIDCPEMEFSKEDFEHLVVLEELKLYGLPKLTCFPEGIKHSAATLGHLYFRPSHRRYGAPHGAPVDLPDWIGTTLTSLEHLVIDAPKNWNVLPQWMQHLTALKELYIHGCNEELYIHGCNERWKNKDTQGEDNRFNMISHVPDVELWQ